ncbi:VirD4-like conjugal transfer protein, CD1115 family [Clostridium felsineum]|uniref:Uncharacterized protein n=1 Tax=Clostridium felsineum TaxID=36839 RepID=A0A1S8L4S1_9CLOT|nr:type IV secretory system conjugative DNA transfer family protein [Clostridium felsineum]MCR3761449.1 type IV secretory system conjugative DNA transfer family protein [Clostridium felsineum]URZ06717.1 hypothetical protein CLROS_020500 [Clostridium felsineum]URZ11750.1 hypothetical protein CROST_024670 [Clostridium felsineum]
MCKRFKIVSFSLIYILVSIYLLIPPIVLRNKFIEMSMSNNYNVHFKKIIIMYKHPFENFKLIITHGYILKEFIITFFIITVLICILYFGFKSRDTAGGITYLRDNGTQGTANWMNKKKMKKVLNIGNEKGIVFGTIENKMVTLPSNTFLNKNIAVFGASGSMKSRSFVRPNIMQLSETNESMIITDPKAEIFESMSEYLRDKGYNVKVLNLVNMINSDRWNPLNEVEDDISAQYFVETVMINTKAPGAKQDEFWDKAEMNLLKALVLYVVKENPEDERNLSSVYSLLALNSTVALDTLFSNLPQESEAKMPYNIYSQASDKVKTGVVIGLGSKLQIFQNKLVCNLTKTSDIDLILPKKEKCAYFCITSDMSSTFDFIAGLFFSFLFIKLVKYADYAPKEHQKDVYFILDEFPNIGAIPDFTKKISTMRSRGISSFIIFQNIAQLQNRYPNNGWSEIIGNCDSRLFLGATDIITSEFVSKLLGTTTVKDTKLSKAEGFEGIIDLGHTTSSSLKRNLMNPDEVLRLSNKNEILILRGQEPILLNKMDYTKHKFSKLIKHINISEYLPNWTTEYYKEKKDNLKDKKKDAQKSDFW